MQVEVHKPNDVKKAASLIEKGVTHKLFLVILGSCSVVYEGRGASKIGKGERLIVIKPDGAILVHRPTGYSPVNWQPESKVITIEARDNELVVRSIRERPRELLEILFDRIDLIILVRDMRDHAEFIEYLDEHEIRDYLAKHPELIEPGLRIIRVEKPIEPGFVDLYAMDSKGRYVVIEIKRVTAGRDAVLQLKRYIDAFKKINKNAEIRGILIAPSISKQALSMLYGLGLEYREINLEKLYRLVREERKYKISGSLLNFLAASKQSK